MKTTLLAVYLSFLIIGCRNAPVLLDMDGNRYDVAQQGDTWWMMENLRTTRNQTGNTVRYYIPASDTSNIPTFGLLYDYETACHVCPDGWRLPTNADWEQLFLLHGKRVNSYQDPDHWEGGTNVSKFNVRPAGVGNSGEHSDQFNRKALFWSSTKEGDHFVWTAIFEKDGDSVRMDSQHPTYAFAVRCVKDK